MAVKLDIRTRISSDATEFYISAVPSGGDFAGEAAEIFSQIRDFVQSKGAFIFQERIFAIQDAMDTLAKVRLKAYGDIDDGVAPAFLVEKKGAAGPLAGVQVYAVSTEYERDVVEFEALKCGRILHTPDRSFLTLSGVTAPECEKDTEQMKAILKKIVAILRPLDGDIFSIPRTWMWLGDILSWYDEFNNVRNKFFTEWGAIGIGSMQSMPASTGIGLGPSNGGKCSVDIKAVLEPESTIKYLQAGGMQQCAFEYGSAFSRASQAASPAGQTVYISGTASIDADGATTNIDNAEAQIKDTIVNVRAVLKDMNCNDEDVVEVMAYCKTTEVERIFNGLKNKPDWPWIPMICDVCRDDLLFEIEAAAMPKS